MDHISYKFLKRLPKQRKLVGELRQAAAVIDESIKALKKGETNRLDGGEPLDPLHTVYLAVQHAASIFAERVSVLDEFEPYYKIVVKAEDEYMPSGPPMSPLTRSYFTTWAFFDLGSVPTRDSGEVPAGRRDDAGLRRQGHGCDPHLLRVAEWASTSKSG